MNIRQKQIKEARQRIKKQNSDIQKLIFVVAVLPVIGDYISDIDMELSPDFKKVYDSIIELDSKVMAIKEGQTKQEYEATVSSQLAIQTEFRKFFKDFCNAQY